MVWWCRRFCLASLARFSPGRQVVLTQGGVSSIMTITIDDGAVLIAPRVRLGQNRGSSHWGIGRKGILLVGNELEFCTLQPTVIES